MEPLIAYQLLQTEANIIAYCIFVYEENERLERLNV